MCSENAYQLYKKLIDLVTWKELATHGVHRAPYGRYVGKESDWQETEKATQLIKEEKRKSPWL